MTEALELFDGEKHKVPRHSNARADAMDFQRVMDKWCRQHGIELEISNLGHHWGFKRTSSRHTAEWWPSSGRLVVNGKYRKAMYAPGIEEVKQEIVRQWCLSERGEEGNG